MEVPLCLMNRNKNSRVRAKARGMVINAKVKSVRFYANKNPAKLVK